ncbi:hypothetical protein DFH08DRAFT_901384 [Mycena albidolilacea]|uniref:Uncharacterized protein n=1 Tax=Mycena albidolilacea TaxID=1033008 RepID=A0AAD6Z411_9AGAR|nr:hypothetical protein DFH08DRAFT_901384 [Mycena albidolilacea]
MPFNGVFTVVLSLGGLATAHFAAWHKGMYCLNGTTVGYDDNDTNSIVNPLFNLTKEDWWFHHYNGCDDLPPDDGDFLELPANGNFTVEIAVNRAFTTLSYDGVRTGVFGDGQNYTNGLGGVDCITELNIHTQNESMAAGTAFAISYQSDLSAVTAENLVVFTILYHTPWRRIATYSVPNLPACPEAGCICAWGWVPNGCGEPNMYMQGYRCKVVGQTGSAAVAPASPPTWCEDTPTNCTTGAKQLVYWNQQDGNNIFVSGSDSRGFPKSPSYNSVLGFNEGPQTDIFLSDGTASRTSVAPGSTGTPGIPSGSSRLTWQWQWLVLCLVYPLRGLY